MVPIKNKVLILFLLIFFSTHLQSKQTESQRCDSYNFSQAYFHIDINLVAPVSKYLYDTFSDIFYEGNAFATILGKRKKTEIYYDNEELTFLNKGAELVHMIDHTLPKYRTDREKIIFHRADINTDTKQTFEVKRYKKKSNPLDKHPLLGNIKRKERPILLDGFSAFGNIAPEKINPVLTVEREEAVFVITHLGKAFGEISLQKYHIPNFGIPNTNVLVKIAAYALENNHMKPDEKTEFHLTLCDVSTEFHNKFPSATFANTVGYQHYHDLANRLLPNRSFFQKHPMLFKLAQALALTTFGFLLLTLFIGRYKKEKSYRIVKYTTK